MMNPSLCALRMRVTAILPGPREVQEQVRKAQAALAATTD
jgi:hypothetical protein